MKTKISKQRWQEIQSVLDVLFDLSEQQKSLYLNKLKIHNPQLLVDVEYFIAAQHSAPPYLDQAAAFLAKDLLTEPKIENDPQGAIGQKIGAYVLQEIIGRGGMGAVYRAERQSQEFEQQVAIKILSNISQGKEETSILLDRFQQEQQTLASLNHPNIAQLFDGGFTADNQPYIVMEYVQGVDINQYCKDNQLGLVARLKLIVQVADVLAFAHKNLIIHRDIKSSNILINASGQVKLLDFGIAKLISNEQISELTKTGESIMTPGSAAPEQIKRMPITVATDIYQLGLVMYQLITDNQAFSDQAESLYELARVICEKLPTAPSIMRVKSPPQEATFADQWRNKLQGDLDAIVLKALRTESDHRYASMQEFGKDIKAHLSGHLVEARQKNLRYLLSSYSRRHWQLVLVASSFLLIILAYAITVTLQSQQIKTALEQSELEAKKAQQVSQFMIDIFKTSDPNISGLEEITALQLLEKSQQNIQKTLLEAPEIRAHMLNVLGDIYYSRGVYEQSEKLLALALEQQRQLPNIDPLNIASTLTKLAISYSTQNKYQQAEELLLESLKLHRTASTQHLSETDHLAYAETLNAYANVLKIRGAHKIAEQNFNHAIEMIKPYGDKQNELAIAYNGLALIQHVQGRFKVAVNNMRKSLQILGLVHGEQHAYYNIALNNLVTMLIDLEYFEEATVLSKKSLQKQMERLGNDHPDVADTLRSLGILAHRQGDFLTAIDYLQQALKNKRQNHNEDNVAIGVILLFLGAVEQDIGRFDQALEQYQTMLNIFRKYQVSDRLLGRGLCQPASLLLATGKWQEANLQYSQALSLLPESGVRSAIAQLGFARSALYLPADLSKAEALSRSALVTRQQKYPSNHSLIAEAQAVLGLVLIKQNKSTEAKPLLIAAHSILSQHPMYTQIQGQDNLLLNLKNALDRLAYERRTTG